MWAQAAEGGTGDAARAVESSRRAFDEGTWPGMGRAARATAIHRLADLIEARAEDLATADARNIGKPLAQAKHDVGRLVRPTIVSGLPRTAPAYCEEIFGPVCVVNTFDAEDQAVALANDTRYGLNAMIFTENLCVPTAFPRCCEQAPCA